MTGMSTIWYFCDGRQVRQAAGRLGRVNQLLPGGGGGYGDALSVWLSEFFSISREVRSVVQPEPGSQQPHSYLSSTLNWNSSESQKYE